MMKSNNIYTLNGPIIVGFIAAVFLFSLTCYLALAGYSSQFDQTVLLMIRETLAPEIWQKPMRNVTALGNTLVLAILCVPVLGLCLLKKRHKLALFMLLTFLGGRFLITFLKQVFDRARPQLFEHGEYVTSAALPSGHAMMGTIGFLILATVFAAFQKETPQKEPSLKIFGYFCAGVIITAIGITRIYLGVHWPTDVIAGWSGGIAWIALCIIVARHFGVFDVHQNPD